MMPSKTVSRFSLMDRLRSVLSAHWRVSISLAIGIVAGLFSAADVHALSGTGAWPPDFDHLWFASRALLHGQDPYPLIGPGRAFEWPFRLNYPLPALLVLAPLAVLPLALARFLFVAIGLGALTYALARDGADRLPLVASAATFHAVVRAQWSPLFAAALLSPKLRWLYATKPTIGGALWFARPTRLPVVAGVLLVAASFALVPTWPLEWMDATRSTPFVVLAFKPGGVLLLLAALRWRQADARLLLGMACMPHTAVFYESLYIMLLARTRRVALCICLLSYVAWFLMPAMPAVTGYAAHVAQISSVILWFVYVPALILVLRRPNTGDLPAPIERLAACLPTRLRGERATA